MAETVDSVLALAQEMGGTMEYWYGVGVKLASLRMNYLSKLRSICLKTL